MFVRVAGGFGLVLDGSEEANRRAENMLNWDVSNGVARRLSPNALLHSIYKRILIGLKLGIIRGWAGNANAIQAIQRAMTVDPRLKVTLPNLVDELAF